MTLTEFLLARIAEDEEAARAAMGEPSYDHFGDTPAEETLEMALNEGCAPEGAAHFRHWMPAHVLAVCEAHRRIVEEHAPNIGILSGQCGTCGDWYTFDEVGGVPYPCPTLRALAAIYADRDGFQEEWRA